MIIINFGRWSHTTLKKYTYSRIYTDWTILHLDGSGWTPFCVRNRRPTYTGHTISGIILDEFADYPEHKED